MTPIPMHEMSWTEIIKDNPEWVAVIVSSVFAFVTVGVVIWQVCVMIWQGRISISGDQRQQTLLRAQNRLFELQLEHQRIQILNAERLLLLNMARKMHLAASCLDLAPSVADQLNWDEVRDTMMELHQRLRVLDVDAYDGPYDQWYPELDQYVKAIEDAVIHDRDFQREKPVTPETSAGPVQREGVPAMETVLALKGAITRHTPLGTFLDIETAIRMEFFEYKSKVDGALA
jgi:hypothetical protein